jgi:hypothetical protein
MASWILFSRSGAAHFYRGGMSQPQNSPKPQTEMARHYSLSLA